MYRRTCRVSNIDADRINLYLDRGVQGVTGPHINDGAQAQAFADACLFPTRDGGPSGRRSWGSGRGTEHGDSVLLEERYGGQAGFMEWSNRNMIVQAQIEAKEGWDNLDEILAVPGITSICVRTSAPIPKRGTSQLRLICRRCWGRGDLTTSPPRWVSPASRCTPTVSRQPRTSSDAPPPR